MSSIVYALAVTLCVVRCVWSQDTAVVTLNKNPVYSGEPVVLTCSYGSQNMLVEVAVDAFNSTQKQGFLRCRIPAPNTTGEGVLREKSFLGCPSRDSGVTNASITMTASPSLELDYNCTAVVIDASENNTLRTLTSDVSSLIVYVLPEVPKIVPTPVVFNEDSTATIICESRNGKPAAAVKLTVTSPSGSHLEATGNSSASLLLSLPLMSWHNGTATCTVTNHEFSNKTLRCGILIHQESKHILWIVICTLTVIGITIGAIGLVWFRKWRVFAVQRRSKHSDVDDRDDKISMTENDLYATAAAQPECHTKEHACEEVRLTEQPLLGHASIPSSDLLK